VDRLGEPAGVAVRDRRDAVPGGLDDHQPPALLDGRREHQPRAGEQVLLRRLVDEAGERDGVRDAERSASASSSVRHQPSPMTAQLQAGPGRPQPRHGLHRVLDALVRHQRPRTTRLGSGSRGGCPRAPGACRCGRRRSRSRRRRGRSARAV
jgi:hypothetical protein